MRLPLLALLTLALFASCVPCPAQPNNTIPATTANSFPNSSENTHLFSAIRKRALTTNATTQTPRIVFGGDSLIGPSDPSFLHSAVNSFANQIGEMFGDSGTSRNPWGRLWIFFTGTYQPGWIGTNWFGQSTWGLAEGQEIDFIGATNVNQIQVAWIKNPAGNAFLGVYTNNANGSAYILCRTLDGFAATLTGAVTNIAVPLDTYGVQVKTLGGPGLQTNVVISGVGLTRTNFGGISSYLFGVGGSTISNFVGVPTNIMAPVLSAINPDAFIWEGLDLVENGGETGYINALNTLYSYVTTCVGKRVVFGIVGVPDGRPFQDGDAQNSFARLACLRRGWMFLDGSMPHSSFTNGLSVDGVHYSAEGAAIAGASLGEQLGLLPQMATLSAILPNFYFNVANVKYLAHRPGIATSNILLNLGTNSTHLIGCTNFVCTNLIEEVTGVAGEASVYIQNTTAVTMGIRWPAIGPQHGYFFKTNGISVPCVNFTSLAAGAAAIARFQWYGSNVVGAWEPLP